MAQPLQTTPPSSTPAAAASPDFVEKTPLERYVPPAKPSLVGFSRAQLTEALASIGVPAAQRKMRAQQIWHWLYVRGARGFDEMTSVSKEVRALLERHFTLARPEVVAEQVSVDGTRKWLLRLPGEQSARSWSRAIASATGSGPRARAARACRRRASASSPTSS